MSYIITEENYQSISAIKEATKAKAMQNAVKDPIMDYASETIHIVGRSLFERFCADEDIDRRDVSSSYYGHAAFRNKSTIATVDVIYRIEYHYDCRNNNGSWSRISKGDYIFADGEILSASFYHSKAAADLSFFEDYRSYYTRLPNSWKKENPAPDRVGVITDKKIQAWLDWLRQRRDIYDGIENQKNAKVTEFLESVRNAAEHCEESRIGETSGSLRSNNLVFTYSISEGGYIHPQIKVDYKGEACLNTFLQMISGSYGK